MIENIDNHNTDLAEAKMKVIDTIFQLLVDEAGLYIPYKVEYEKEDFVNAHMRTEKINDFAGEYWFRTTNAGEMKLFYDLLHGFKLWNMYSIGKETADRVNEKLRELKFQA